jgi:hypothetical protein
MKTKITTACLLLSLNFVTGTNKNKRGLIKFNGEKT